MTIFSVCFNIDIGRNNDFVTSNGNTETFILDINVKTNEGSHLYTSCLVIAAILK